MTKTTRPAKFAEASVFGCVKELYPEAPDVGAQAKVFLGVVETEDSAHHTTVRGPEDTARPCVVLGYTLELGDTRPSRVYGRRPADCVRVLVTVRLHDRARLLKRTTLCDIGCLECVPSKLKRN